MNRRTLLAIFGFLMVGLSYACSYAQKAALKNTSGINCELKKAPIRDPLLKINFFSSDVENFDSNNSWDYQYILVISPENDDSGFMLDCKVTEHKAILTIRSAADTKNYELDFEKVVSLFSQLESGGYFKLCPTNANHNIFYYSMVKHGSETIFQYQGLNAPISETDLNNVLSLYHLLMSYNGS